MSVGLLKQLADIAEIAAKKEVGSIHVAATAEVVEYDSEEWTALVRQEVKQRSIDEDGESVYDEVVIPGVPIKWPVFQGFSIVGHLERGDQVLLVFADRSHEDWMRGEGPGIEADSNRRFDYTDAFALPGALAPGETLASPDSGSLEIRHHESGSVMRINDDGTVAFGTDANDLVDLFVSLVTTLVNATVTTATGTYPFSPPTVTELQNIKSDAEQIQEP